MSFYTQRVFHNGRTYIGLARCIRQQNSVLLCSTQAKGGDKNLKKANTPIGRLDDKWEGKAEEMLPQSRNDSNKSEKEAYSPFPNEKNPETGEIGGPRGPEPTRYGDWERKGRVIDF